jgi:hypothetical protein
MAFSFNAACICDEAPNTKFVIFGFNLFRKMHSIIMLLLLFMTLLIDISLDGSVIFRVLTAALESSSS